MTLDDLRGRLAALTFFDRTRQQAAALPPGRRLRLRGTVGSLPAFVLADLLENNGGPLVALLDTSEAADYLRSDLEQLLGSDARVAFFPPTGQVPYDPEQLADSLPLVQRADVLGRLREGFDGVLVTSVEAMSELVPPPETVRAETLTVRVGDQYDPEALVDRLVAQGFERVEFAGDAGEVALRGGILDVFPYAGGYPVRLEFFGDEVDSIREFDPATQRSIARTEQARLVPNLDAAGRAGAHVTPLDFLPEKTLVATFDDARLAEEVQKRFEAAEKRHTELQAAREKGEADPGAPLPPPETRYLAGAALQALLDARSRVLFGTFAGQADETLSLEARPQPAFNGDMGRLRGALNKWRQSGWTGVVLADSASQRDRLFELLGGDEDAGKQPDAELIVESLHEGFEVEGAKLAVYTDHQIFGRYHRPTARKRRRVKGGLSLREVQGLSPGDFVVHVDHGIGRFAGLHTITVREQKQEAVRLIFEGGDELFVSVGALHKLHKYSGKEGHQPRLTKLGTGAWDRLKERTKRRVKDIARDLIKLYAERKRAPGFAFSRDTIWQRELEAAFPYEDTPDQAATTEALKADMEQATPMDRLVCGDVGFGKTEMAVRAAFKAVQDGKQVAVIVPTTILSAQHFETFQQRMGRYPVRIAQLSRFVPPQEQKEVAAALREGAVDVVIGTQRLLSKDVKFKDLGLMIVDEEQRFGVGAKEKLRTMRPNVDTLTLTATPIPRTLQFSLLGARDLSLIQTPPPNRQPILTEIHTFNRDLIRDAILYEVNRGGQVFFLHNRVQTIEEVSATIQALVPDVRVRFAHGQMSVADLESAMLDFMQKRFDVLVCTNIVESGLDVSNANTILINHAERFGLADLHQLRGRVGRSDQKAFCYLLVPSVHTLTREARQRLQAVEELADLGAGFHIAMRDLDIRGAGTMLGAEQSGFIEDVGFETYHALLDEAVQELRHDEFADVFQDQVSAPPAPQPMVEADEDLFIPADYVQNAVERLNLYRRLADVATEVELEAFRTELEDRFGPVPEAVEALLTMAAMKPHAQALRLPRVGFRNERLFLTFPASQADPYFYEHRFQPLLDRLEGLGRRYVLKEKDNRLRAIVQDVPTLADAAGVLERLAEPEMEAA